MVIRAHRPLRTASVRSPISTNDVHFRRYGGQTRPATGNRVGFCRIFGLVFAL